MANQCKDRTLKALKLCCSTLELMSVEVSITTQGFIFIFTSQTLSIMNMTLCEDLNQPVLPF